MMILSPPGPFPKSKMRPYVPVLDDLNQNANDMPLDPVVKGATCTYWLLDATNDTLPVPTRLSLVIEAPFTPYTPKVLTLESKSKFMYIGMLLMHKKLPAGPSNLLSFKFKLAKFFNADS